MRVRVCVRRGVMRQCSRLGVVVLVDSAGYTLLLLVTFCFQLLPLTTCPLTTG